MDSKMKPLWLVFENEDKTGQDVYQIFKHGDGKIFIELCVHFEKWSSHTQAHPTAAV